MIDCNKEFEKEKPTQIKKENVESGIQKLLNELKD